MPIEKAAQELAEFVRRGQADYVEAHLEESQTSHIIYRGRELESIGRSEAVGGNVRARPQLTGYRQEWTETR